MIDEAGLVRRVDEGVGEGGPMREGRRKGMGSEALINPRRLEHLVQERDVRPDHDQRDFLRWYKHLILLYGIESSG